MLYSSLNDVDREVKNTPEKFMEIPPLAESWKQGLHLNKKNGEHRTLGTAIVSA